MNGSRNEERCEKTFVYGSLRRGQRYRYRIDRHVIKAQRGTVRGRMFHYAAWPDGTGPWPYIVPGAGTVQGELLSFRDFDEAIAVLDEIEDCPRLYVRRVVEVSLQDERREPAWTYFIRPGEERRGREVPGGDWVAERERCAMRSGRGVNPRREARGPHRR